MQEFIKVIDGVDFQMRTTAEGLTEVHTSKLESTLAAVQYLNDQGYELYLSPSDGKHWPLNRRPNIFFMQKKGEYPEGSISAQNAELNEVKENAISSTEYGQEGQEKAQEQDNKEVEKETTAVLSTEELLEGPDWKAIQKLGKPSLEVEALRWSIQLDASTTKPKMIEAFKEAWSEKAGS